MSPTPPWQLQPKIACHSLPNVKAQLSAPFFEAEATIISVTTAMNRGTFPRSVSRRRPSKSIANTATVSYTFPTSVYSDASTCWGKPWLKTMWHVLHKPTMLLTGVASVFRQCLDIIRLVVPSIKGVRC